MAVQEKSLPRRKVKRLESILSPLHVVLDTLKTISDIHQAEQRAFSERRLTVSPSKRPPGGRRRKRKLPIKINKRPKQVAGPVFSRLRAREPVKTPSRPPTRNSQIKVSKSPNKSTMPVKTGEIVENNARSFDLVFTVDCF